MQVKRQILEHILTQCKRMKEKIEFNREHDRYYEEAPRYITAWKRFKALTDKQRDEIMADWAKYYRNVQNTPIAQLFYEQQKAAHNNDWGRVKQLAKEAQLMRKNGDVTTLKKPTSIDPWEFKRGWVAAYKELTKKISELSDMLNMPVEHEVKEIWHNH